jgi:ribonuclease P protein component
VTKRIGNAVIRNRIKRRFRELLREVLPHHGLAGHDHVMIGRDSADTRDFAVMKGDLEKALKRLAEGKSDPARRRKGARSNKGGKTRGKGGSP